MPAVPPLPVADQNFAAWQSVRIANLLTGQQWLRPDDALLAGLIAATGLTRHVLWERRASTAGFAYLPHVIAGLHPSLRVLVTHTEAAVGQTVLAPR